MLIRIDRLHVDTTLGVTAAERAVTRPVVIDVQMDVDVGAALRTDRVADTVDYTLVRDRIVSTVTGARYHLLESLTHAVLDAVVCDARIRRATVTVTKPQAMRMAEAVSACARWRRTSTAASPSSGGA